MSAILSEPSPIGCITWQWKCMNSADFQSAENGKYCICIGYCSQKSDYFIIFSAVGHNICFDNFK